MPAVEEAPVMHLAMPHSPANLDHWQDGEVTGLQVDDVGFEEARSLTRPAMTYVRGQLRGRLTARLGRVHRRWLHPTSGRRPSDRFP
jgi:hypothetical protein